MDDRGAELKWGQSILKHLSLSTVVMERQREDLLPLQTPMCPSGKHICLSLSMTGDLLVSKSPWWMVTFPLFYHCTKSCAYLLWWPTWSCFLYLASFEELGDFFKRGSVLPRSSTKPHLCSLCLPDFTSLVDPHWPSRVFPWVMCIVWLSHLSTSVEHISIYFNCLASSHRRCNPFWSCRAQIERFYFPGSG